MTPKKCLAIIGLWAVFGISQLYSQDEIRTNNFISVGINYGGDLPAADLADRYGTNFHAGLSVLMYNLKLKGFIGLEGNFQFGANVKEDVLAPLRLESGAILGDDGTLSDLFLRRRGTYFGITANKTLVPMGSNPYAGLAAGIGIGLLQHNIRIIDDTNNTPAVEGDYAKGYDRNTRGFALKQTITYQHIGTNRSMNYSLGISITEGFTKSVRSVNFDTGLPATGGRMDILIGLEATWYLPVKDLGEVSEIYY